MHTPNDSNTSSTPTAAVDPIDALGKHFKGFVVGDEHDERKAGKTVAIAINVNIQIKNGQQDRCGCVPIHEIPFLRRAYSDGEIFVLPGWVPGIDRRKEMKQAALDEEVRRLSQTYVRVTQSGKTDFAADILGPTPTERKPKLAEIMLAVAKAWKVLEDQAIVKIRAKYPDRIFQPMEIHGVVGEVLTAGDFDALIALVEPARNTLDSIDLDAINAGDLALGSLAAPAPAPAASDDTPADPIQDLLEAFEAAGFTAPQSQSIAALAMEHPNGIPEELLVTIDGMKNGAVVNKRKLVSVSKVVAANREQLKALAGV